MKGSCNVEIVHSACNNVLELNNYKTLCHSMINSTYNEYELSHSAVNAFNCIPHYTTSCLHDLLH